MEVNAPNLNRAYPDLSDYLAEAHPNLKTLFLSPHFDEAKENPYLALLYRRTQGSQRLRIHPLFWYQALKPFFSHITGGDVSLWHQHWLQCSSFPTFLRVAFRLFATLLYRVVGGRVLWTLHNESPHVRRWLFINRIFNQTLAKLAYRIHVHHHQAIDVAAKRLQYDPKKMIVIPAPNYDVEIISNADARAFIEKKVGFPLEGKRVFLMFGIVSEYKGVDGVLDAFQKANPSNALLLVAGKMRSNEMEYCQNLLSRFDGKNSVWINTYIADRDVGYYMGAADWVVFNHHRSLNSGAMLLAANHGCSLLVPDVDSLHGIPSDTPMKVIKDENEWVEAFLTAPKRQA